jgi:exopolysaccharide biosynthesis polyprenyl glycosylphosphotransferase
MRSSCRKRRNLLVPRSDILRKFQVSSIELENELLEPLATEPAAEIVTPVTHGLSSRRNTLVRRSLIAADLLSISAAFLLAFVLFGAARGASAAFEFRLLLVTLPGWVAVASVNRLYRQDAERTHHSTTDDVPGVVQLVTIGTLLFYGGISIGYGVALDLGPIAASWVLAVALVCLGRVCARAWYRRRAGYLQRTIIIGAGDVGQRLARKVMHHPEYGIELVGFVDDEPRPKSAQLERLDLLGGPDDLLRIVRDHRIERVMIAFSGAAPESTIAATRALTHHDVRVDVVPRLFDLVSPSMRVDTLEAFPILTMPPARVSRTSDAAKRVLDVIVASIGVVLAAPLLAFIAWRVHRDSPGPVLFRQTRLGLDQREFTAFKFRTMRTDVDIAAHKEYIERSMHAGAAPAENGLYKLEQRDAVTPSGRWLRRTSMDELPQLFNVLRGEMSIVGPRPCIPYETAHFQAHHFERFGVRPGITGLWQVTARAHSTFVEALDMDVAYARGHSFALDLQLLLRTPAQLLGRGVTR